jgi:FG-GAP repeat
MNSTRMCAFRFLLVAATAARLAGTAPAQYQEAKLLAHDGTTSDIFGASVAMDGDFVSVGMPWDDTPVGGDSGSVRLYSRVGGWTETQTLMGSDTQPGDLFGSALGMNRGRLLVGSFFGTVNGQHQGSAFVFNRNGATWTEETKLWATDVNTGTGFGTSVAIDGAVIVCGAPSDNQTGNPAGAAYVYRRSGGAWTLEAKLVPGDILPNEEFGEAVAVHDEVIVVGARRDDDLGLDSGSVYVYRHQSSGWSQEAKLHASDGSANDWFGEEVAVWDDLICVGAPYHGINDDGEAYVFRHSSGGWTEEASLHDVSNTSNIYFGSAVAVRSEYILVGGPQEFLHNHASGNALGFRHGPNGWYQDARFVGSDPANNDQFGAAVCLGDEELVVGAYNKSLSGMPGVGAAYVFTAHGPTPYCTAKTNSQGCEPLIESNGVARLSGVDNFHVVGLQVLNNCSGMLLWSQGSQSLPWAGGTLCIGPDLHRTWIQDSGGLPTGSDCTGDYDFHLTHSWMAGQGWLPGMRVYAQFLSRDPGFPPGQDVGLTAALRITICP